MSIVEQTAAQSMKDDISSRIEATLARASATVAAVRADAGDGAVDEFMPNLRRIERDFAERSSQMMLKWSKRFSLDYREYVEKAKLPPMELSTVLPQYHSHANRLSIKHESRRRLEYVNIIPQSLFFSSVTRFLSAVLSGDRRYLDDDPVNGGGITIPVPGFTLSHPLTAIGKVSNVTKAFQWVMGYPLMTANHLVHQIFPRTRMYTLQDGVEQVDEDIFRWVIWARDEETITASEDLYESDSVMIMVQPPWVLAKDDLQSFVQLGTFPKPDPESQHSKPMTSSQRLWGKVWDLCHQKRAHWFVITSYEYWVFGCFTRGWTNAYVSPIMADYTGEPTVVQCLLFWFSSAVADLAKSEHVWSLPVVPESIDIEDPEEEISRDMPDRNDGDLMSESEWSAHSAARSHTPSGVVSDDEDDARMVELQLTSDTPSDTFPDQQPSRSRAVRNWERVDEWYAQLRSSGNLSSLSRPPPPPSIAPSATSITTVSTVSTVRDYSNSPIPDGTWMTG